MHACITMPAITQVETPCLLCCRDQQWARAWPAKAWCCVIPPMEGNRCIRQSQPSPLPSGFARQASPCLQAAAGGLKLSLLTVGLFRVSCSALGAPSSDPIPAREPSNLGTQNIMATGTGILLRLK
ncbi:hypothetical protein B0H67DRAFT_142966 [Lasiosphaeris hirsuta]|uniref:Uncharacterized protein n=1 Tax=Lasiosphaeris hirsuta TaxID=260670 RepID=A0AA40B1L8_9PEZI|nr:hypothetical protein B0H67DRAFT_142966 [Lasiosphaeris hirsuta]